MNTYPELEAVMEIAATREYRRVPVKREIYADSRTPIEVLKILKRITKHCYMLESVENRTKRGRYTFLGYDPTLEITCRDGHLTMRCCGTEMSEETDDPTASIRKILADNKAPKIEGLPPFAGGLVGYFSYEYLNYTEPELFREDEKDEEKFNDLDLMLFENVICFDNYRQKIILIANIRVDDPGEVKNEYEKGIVRIGSMEDLIKNGKPADDEPLKLLTPMKEMFSEEEYCGIVEKTKEYIKEGDIFQAVLSNRLEAEIEGSLLDTYRVLRTTNPSPYMFYFSGQDIEMAGASPETLAKLEDGEVSTFPLAGTRPRGKTDEEDAELEKDLLSDEKELAEHNMLVDLGRNDIGKISEIGSVKVEKYHEIERFSHVMHIGSTVKGKLAKDMDAADVVSSILPAGTLSGAPKIRACEIISGLEGERRGIYGGAIGYLDLMGNLDTCIGIRLAFAKNNKLFIRSGAGIVLDSVPKNEYKECGNKARAVVDAVYEAEGGID